MEQGQSWFLVAIAGSLKGHELPLTERRVSIGREETSDLVLLDDNVSRRHLELHVQSRRVILTDLGSRNGTFINNQRVSGTKVLNHGDRLALGSHLLEVQGRTLPAAVGFDDDIQLGETSDDDKTVVHPLRGQTEWMPPGRGAAPKQAEPAPEATLKVPEHHDSVEINPESTIIAPSVPQAKADPRHLTASALIPSSGGPRPRKANKLNSAPVLEVPQAARSAAAPAPRASVPEIAFSTPEIAFSTPEIAFSTPELPALDPQPEDPKAKAPEPENPAEVRARNSTMLFGGAAMIIIAMMGVLIVTLSQRSPGSAAEERQVRAKPAASELTSDMGEHGTDSISALLSGEGGSSLIVGPQAYQLDETEKAMSAADRDALAQETFDQAVSFAESEKFKEALREFNHALALDGTCDICMIRANKVAQQIKQRIEKYNSDGLRYFQAMKYEKAERSWERALLLLDDPQSPAGQMIQTKMGEARQQQARQSYR